MSELVCMKTNIPPGRLYEESLLVGSVMRLHVLKHCGVTSGFVFGQNGGWHFIINFHDLFLRKEYHSGLNLLLDNDSRLLFMIFQTSSIELKSWKLTYQLRIQKEIAFMQGNFLCIYPKSAKHFLDIRRTSVFDCPGDSLDLRMFAANEKVFKLFSNHSFLIPKYITRHLKTK